METTKSEQLYLKTIYNLSLKMDYVKSVDIAKKLNYSRPSVLGLLRKLEDKGLIIFGEKKRIILTEEGKSIACIISNRHKVLKMAFIGLGASEELAEKDAYNMENHISDKMLEIIDNHINLHLNELKEKQITLKELENNMRLNKWKKQKN